MSTPTERSSKTRILALCLAGIITAVFFIVLAFVTTNGSEKTPLAPVAGVSNYQAPTGGVGGLTLPLVPLEGTWKFKENGTAFVANVSGKNIKIIMSSGDDGSGMTYWKGSFETMESPGHKIISNASDDEIALSLDKTKVFTVDASSLSFQFTALGLTRTIVMTR